MANHNLNDLNENDLTDYRFSRNSSSLSKYKDFNGFHDDSGVSANGFNLDDDEKSYIDMDALSDLGSHSVSKTKKKKKRIHSDSLMTSFQYNISIFGFPKNNFYCHVIDFRKVPNFIIGANSFNASNM